MKRLALLTHHQRQEFSAKREKRRKTQKTSFLKKNVESYFFREFHGKWPTGTNIVSAFELIINWKLNSMVLFEYWTRLDLEISQPAGRPCHHDIRTHRVLSENSIQIQFKSSYTTFLWSTTQCREVDLWYLDVLQWMVDLLGYSQRCTEYKLRCNFGGLLKSGCSKSNANDIIFCNTN